MRLGEPLFLPTHPKQRMRAMPSEKKKTDRRRISPSERTRRAEKREQKRAQSLADIPRLLYSREQTRHALGGISIASVIRLENRGLLEKVRLAGSDNGQVLHPAEQVHALAGRRDHVE
jgi:hypothetical protein